MEHKLCERTGQEIKAKKIVYTTGDSLERATSESYQLYEGERVNLELVVLEAIDFADDLR